ncbi:alpha/beta hydrolase [Salinisphaera aquimarina]|uniref:Alpha/beta hydrolase n=1 Tax=Salinisphaera aquimarina TaxID=2094031 RepID=A0ABV7EQA7_9GAMM
MLKWPDDKKSVQGLIEGPAGALQVDVDLPKDPPRGLVVIAHPHPQQGGTKDNKVVFMLGRAANEAGLAAVRFNFRGVGDSEGEYDDGVGEVDDVRAVRDWAVGASRLDLAALAGFSFGSAAALRVAATQSAPKLLTVGFPSAYFDNDVPRPDGRWLAIFGDADDVIDVSASIDALRALEPAVDVQILEGAGHFLHGRLTDLRKRAVSFLGEE